VTATAKNQVVAASNAAVAATSSAKHRTPRRLADVEGICEDIVIARTLSSQGGQSSARCCHRRTGPHLKNIFAKTGMRARPDVVTKIFSPTPSHAFETTSNARRRIGRCVVVRLPPPPSQ
jgi:hypothetical protein